MKQGNLEEGSEWDPDQQPWQRRANDKESVNLAPTVRPSLFITPKQVWV
jgi:hypothetical protein